jgi:hypothetical protein
VRSLRPGFRTTVRRGLSNETSTKNRPESSRKLSSVPQAESLENGGGAIAVQRPGDESIPGGRAVEREPVVGGACPGCGLLSETWSEPISRGEEVYCCPGCATGGVCACVPPIEKEDEV